MLVCFLINHSECNHILSLKVVFVFDNNEILTPEDHVHCLVNSRFCHRGRSVAQAVCSEVLMFSLLHLFRVVPVVLQLIENHRYVSS